MCATCGCSEGALGHEHHPVHDHDHTHDHGDGHTTTHDHGRLHSRPEPEESRLLRLEQDVLAKNNLQAERNRGWFEGRGILALNLMSSPGSGKTTLLEATARELGPAAALHVIEGDQETSRDADRVRAAGGRVVQVNTGTGCHLDAAMVSRALQGLQPPPRSVVMIENVGNLVCPALFDLGERARVVVASVTEGEDKPLKYPHMFRSADLLLLNKVDLLPHVAFDVERCLAWARQVNPRLRVMQVSALRGDGLGTWLDWLRQAAALPASA